MPKKQIWFITVAVSLIVVVAVAAYKSRKGGAKKAEAFQDTPTMQTAPPPPPAPKDKRAIETEIAVPEFEVPYAKPPINSEGDYEYNMVFQNESDRALTQELRNKLMSQYPMHWTGYPPSSSQFQAGLRESFVNATPNVPDDAKPYENVSGNMMQPPDLSEGEKAERKILQTYKPKFPPSPTSYDIRDVKMMIDQYYDAKGLIPEIRHKDGSNVYEIIGTRKIDDKPKFEDEADAPTEGGQPKREGSNIGVAGTTPLNPIGAETTVKAPLATNNWGSPDHDTFYDKGTTLERTRMNKWDYTAWTPGLERMFAPTESQKDWY